jgi:hypothetical protein
MPVLVLILTLLSVLIVGGCGSSGGDQTTAIATDKIVMPTNESLTIDTGIGAGCFAGGNSVLFTPLIVTVTDLNGNPKNNIEVTLYTDGFWSTTNAYLEDLTGSGPLREIKFQTDDHGRVVQSNGNPLYWSSEVMPPANDPVGAPLVDGADISSFSFVNAQSGIATGNFKFTWTVKGCKAP